MNYIDPAEDARDVTRERDRHSNRLQPETDPDCRKSVLFVDDSLAASRGRVSCNQMRGWHRKNTEAVEKRKRKRH